MIKLELNKLRKCITCMLDYWCEVERAEGEKEGGNLYGYDCIEMEAFKTLESDLVYFGLDDSLLNMRTVNLFR